MDVVANRYEIESELGRGGMAYVYLASDRKLGRRVALKKLVLSEIGPKSDEAVWRFMREAQVMGSLLHPAIVILYDVVEEGDDLYLVMEYYPSKDLSDYVTERGRLDEDEVRRIGARLASALEAAHAKGIVHRDVKPENVLVGDDGAKLTDFGVARIMEGVGQPLTRLTQSGYYVGTPGYLAPEVIKGDSATPASDTFGLGLVMYFALSGSDPYKASDVASLLYQIVYEPLDFSSLAVSPELRAIIESAAAKDPDARPASSELRRLLEGEQAFPGASLSGAELSGTGTGPIGVLSSGGGALTGESAGDPAEEPTSQFSASLAREGSLLESPSFSPPALAAPPVSSQASPSHPLQPQPLPLPAFPVASRRKTPTFTILIGIALGAVLVVALIVSALVAVRPSGTGARKGKIVPEGWSFHESQLGYTATIPSLWTTEVDPATRVEFLWSPGQEGGVIVADLGSADISIYSLKSEELVAKVKSDLSLEEGYSIDEASLRADPTATFGGIKAAKVGLEIAGAPNQPRYRAELYLFNRSDKMWAVIFLARPAVFDSFRGTFAVFERSFRVSS